MANTNLQSLVLSVAWQKSGSVTGLESKASAMDQTAAMSLSLQRHPTPAEPAHTGKRFDHNDQAVLRAGRPVCSVGGSGSRGLAINAKSRPRGYHFPA